MLSLPQLKRLVAGNAVLSAAASAGDIKLVYPKASTISDDRLYGVWTLEVLLVEPDEADLIEGALRRGGFEYKRTKNGWLASYSFALTPKDREKLEKQDAAAKAEQEAVKLKKKDNEVQTALAEIRAEIAEIKEDQDLAGILKPAAGAQGPVGPRGPAGPPGKDAQSQDFKLGDLADVSSENPREGFVLTWRENQWLPQAPRVGGGGGGGGGGGLPDAPADGKQYVRQDGLWVEISHTQQEEAACTDGGDACDHDPQTSTISGADACLADPHTTELDAGFGCIPCLDDIDNDGGGGGVSLTVQERTAADLAALPTSIVTNVTTISFDTDSGFIVQDLGNGQQEALIRLSSTFNPWHVAGQTTLDATGEEPVEFVAGNGMVITTDATATPKQIIFEAQDTFPEAPQDGQQYVRQDGQWVLAAPGGIEEAPQDGQEYTRKDGQWVLSTNSTGGIPDAPLDGKDYVRNNGQWVETDLSVNCCDRVTDLETEVENLKELILNLIGSGSIDIDALTLEDGNLIENEDGTIISAE